jgi:hypothetical protein
MNTYFVRADRSRDESLHFRSLNSEASTNLGLIPALFAI